MTVSVRDNVKHFLPMATTEELLEELASRYVAFLMVYEVAGQAPDTSCLGWAWGKSFSSVLGLLEYGQMRADKIAAEHINKQA